MGGKADPAQLREVIIASSEFRLVNEFVCLKGHEDLLGKSHQRTSTNRLVNGKARAVAEAFASQLVRACPFVDCVALSGSVATGGYVPTDDIDLDLFVLDGTKYIAYAIALGIGLRFALRHWNQGRLRKIICINVIWTRGQTAPFVRKDPSLAFELLHCRPIVGAEAYRAAIARNPWIEGYFPQVSEKISNQSPHLPPNRFGRVLLWIASHPRLLRLAERLGRAASFAVYATAHWLKRNDSAAMQRLDFLRRAKYPYEVFQD